MNSGWAAALPTLRRTEAPAGGLLAGRTINTGPMNRKPTMRTLARIAQISGLTVLAALLAAPASRAADSKWPATIPPTGKAYRIPMATIGHWGKDGIMFEEYLFWVNGEFRKQIGLGK
jgi:hypothetical protein